MLRCSCVVLLCSAVMLASASSCSAQMPPTPIDRANFTKILGFENERNGDKPGGWNFDQPSTVFNDDKIVHSGHWSARLERNALIGEGSAISRSISWEFSGKSIEMRGFLRTENVTGFAGLWMRQDSDSGMLSIDNMESQQLKGTHDWLEYKITLPIMAEMRSLVFGFLMVGTGKAWADDLQILVDGRPLWETPRLTTILDRDHEYDGGSRIALSELSAVQIQNLVTAGKVWGFLKYHHPLIIAGERHWDYDLLRVLPAVLSAPNRVTANAALAKWIGGLGPVKPCACVKLDEKELHLRPRLAWLDDNKLLGAELSASLQSIHANRPVSKKQFYVSQAPNAGNALLDHELSYESIKLPDAGYQILALYRFWNIIEYWFPYRDVVPEDWDKVLMDSLPKVALAKTPEAYQLAMMEVIARVHDTHANLWSSMAVRPPTGTCQLPVNVRFIEGLPVISGYATQASETRGIKRGDIITALDGLPIAKLMDQWKPYYAASNEPTRLRDIAFQMTRGDCGKTRIRLRRRNAAAIEISAERLPSKDLPPVAFTHDLPGETFRLLSKDVAYLKLSAVKMDQAAKYIESAAGTKGLIVDIRNYPAEFVVFALGSLFVDQQTDFVRPTRGDLSNPGAFYWGMPFFLMPQQPHYPGKVVILVDELTQSSAEYTAMAFRSSPRAMVIGSTTAGADGNVSEIPLPGGFRSKISGVGVFYADKKPTQRIGIIPDREVKPTIAGIRAGRDEVLEAAIREIVGKDIPAAQIEKMIEH